ADFLEKALHLHFCLSESLQAAKFLTSHARKTVRVVPNVPRKAASRCAIPPSKRKGLRPSLVMRRTVFDPLTKRFVVLILDELAPVGDHCKQVVKTGNAHHADQRTYEHPADRRGTDRPVANGTRTGGTDQRDQTGDKGERGHRDRPEAQITPFDSRV